MLVETEKTMADAGNSRNKFDDLSDRINSRDTELNLVENLYVKKRENEWKEIKEIKKKANVGQNAKVRKEKREKKEEKETVSTFDVPDSS